MAYKGTAAKSASGASMSKYDVEVESRLQALESLAHSKCDGGGSGAVSDDLAAKVQEMYEWYQVIKKKV